MLDRVLDALRLADPLASGFLFLAVGTAVLLAGAELFVVASVRLSRRLGLPRITVGLTLVAVGTSLPELGASLVAVLHRGEEAAALALGNALGSNVANIGLLLGLAALYRPVRSGGLGVWRHLGFLLAVTGGFGALACLTHEVTRPAGLVALVAFFVYHGLVFRAPVARYPGAAALEPTQPGGTLALDAALFLAGGVMVLGGAEVLVRGAMDLAGCLAVSAGTIGAAVVAVGTSIPELAVCFSAARRREQGLLLGNLIGSNVANLLLVLGACSVVRPLAIHGSALVIYTPATLVFTVAMVVVIHTGGGVRRAEGLGLLGLYAVFQVIVWSQ